MSGPSNNRNEYGGESSVASLRTFPADYSGLYIKKQGRNNGMKLYFRSMYSLLLTSAFLMEWCLILASTQTVFL